MPPVTTQSTVPDFALALQAAWLAQLTADTLTTTQVVVGPPSQQVLDLPEFAAILDADVTVSVRALNVTTQPRDERFKQTVSISVVGQTASDTATSEARAFLIYQSLETKLRANPALAGYYNGPGFLVAARPDTIAVHRRAEETRRESALTIVLAVHARL